MTGNHPKNSPVHVVHTEEKSTYWRISSAFTQTAS